MNGIGGDNFWLIYNAKSKKLKAINGSGRSGEIATIDFYKSKGFSKIPSRGALAANTVPGAVAGWGKHILTVYKKWEALYLGQVC